MLSPESLKDCPPHVRSGVGFNTISVNPGVYLPWIKSELSKRGVRFIKERLVSLDQAAAMTPDGGIIVNATGLGICLLYLSRPSANLTITPSNVTCRCSVSDRRRRYEGLSYTRPDNHSTCPRRAGVCRIRPTYAIIDPASRIVLVLVLTC